MKVPKVRGRLSQRSFSVPLLLLIFALALPVSAASAAEITGVQPYALDHPRVPAFLSPPGEDDTPLAYYSDLHGRRIFSFECFIDTAASRIVLGKKQQERLGVRTTGNTVEDIGIGGVETFDVSEPYELHVGDSATAPGSRAQYPFSIHVVMEVKQKEMRMDEVIPKDMLDQLDGAFQGLGSTGTLAHELIPSLNIIGTPFLSDHIAILDPRPVADAYDMLSALMGGSGGGSAAGLDKLLTMLASSGGSGQFGRIRVSLTSADEKYAEPLMIVPLYLRNMESGDVPVTNAPIPFINDVVIKHAGTEIKVDLALDTGGAVSLMSPDIARKLGFDLHTPDLKAMVMGVGGGNTELKGYWVDRISVETVKGGPLEYHRAPFFIADITGLQGTFGANLLIPSVYVDMEKMLEAGSQAGDPLTRSGQMFSDMKSGSAPFRRIIIDLPHGRLGLEPF